MTTPRYAWLVWRALCELVRFDVIHAVRGFPGIRRQLARHRVRPAQTARATEADVCDAVVLASCLYWKPVRCLQRSVCAVRLLRSRGIAARLVIGCRPVPFFSHAWAEVDDRVVNDSPEYAKQLQRLLTV
jgi:hypothetical protein